MTEIRTAIANWLADKAELKLTEDEKRQFIQEKFPEATMADYKSARYCGAPEPLPYDDQRPVWPRVP
jgi:hypothetical protein